MDSSRRHPREKMRSEKATSHKHKVHHKGDAKKGSHKDAGDQEKPEKGKLKESSHNHGKNDKHEHKEKKIRTSEPASSYKSSNGQNSESDTENGQQRDHRHHHHYHHRHRHHRHHHKKMEDEESFEELSRRKKMIESELHALDAEEAAAAAAAEQDRAKKRRSDRDHVDRHQSRHQDEHPVRIKQEPLSDEESRRKRARPSAEARHRHNGSVNREPGAERRESGKPEDSKPPKPEKEKEKPNFQTSGKLAEDTNTYNGVVIKYNEPAEARKPRRKWRLYPFKGDTSLPFIPIHRQSAYLLGRSRLIADIPIDHPSCSKQHAVLQFRLLPYEKPDGTTGKSVRPYIIDLESSNGTYVNNKRIEPRRYVELFEKDVLKFGFSTRVYVILHEDSKNDDDDDDAES